MTKRPQGESPAQGRIVEVLDDLRPSDLAARFAILRHDLPQAFPPEVLAAANRFAPEVQAADRAGREDLRDMPLVTIDGADAKDFDDAVYAEPLRGGGWRVVVAIADVSHYVRFGSELDLEARARATSVYFPDRVIPMLPETSVQSSVFAACRGSSAWLSSATCASARPAYRARAASMRR